MIWRVGAPAALFSVDKASPGRLDDAAFALWGRARVDVDVAGQTTPGGISDLLFLPDGSLALTSTPSTADGAAGALWRVDHAEGGALSPRLLQRFPGLKPEGSRLALSRQADGRLRHRQRRASVPGAAMGPVKPQASRRALSSAIARGASRRSRGALLAPLCLALTGCYVPLQTAGSDRAIAIYHEGHSRSGALTLRREDRGGPGPKHAANDAGAPDVTSAADAELDALTADRAVAMAKDNSARLAALEARAATAAAEVAATDQYPNPVLTLSNLHLDDMVDGKPRVRTALKVPMPRPGRSTRRSPRPAPPRPPPARRRSPRRWPSRPTCAGSSTTCSCSTPRSPPPRRSPDRAARSPRG